MAKVNRIFFPEDTDAQLRARLARAKDDLEAGRLVSWSAGDTSAARGVNQRDATPRQVIWMCLNDLGYTEAERSAMPPHDNLPVVRLLPRYL